MLCRCYRLALLCWLACWSLHAVASDLLIDQSKISPSERQWLSTHSELVIGMPSAAWPPYVYTDGRGNFTGPLDAFASQVAVRLGLSLRYQNYPSNADAQQALLNGEVDMLIGVAPSPTRQLQMLFTSALMAVPRGILLTGGQYDLSLEKARGLRWVCVFGVSACDELLRLGILDLVTVDSRDEAIFMLKEGRADAYLGDLPALTRVQAMAGLKLVTVDWMRDSSLAMAVAPGNEALLRLLDLALHEISPIELRRILETSGILGFEPTKVRQEIAFNQHEQAWLAQHPVIKFGVFPDWPGMSEIDDSGLLKPGYVSDLLALMSQRAGLQFEVVSTKSWHETLDAFQAGKLDLIPAITPTLERQQLARFTPDYGSLSRVIVARQGSKELSSLKALKGQRVGIVGSSVDTALLAKMGAEPVIADSYYQMLSLLDDHSADYVLMTVNTLGQSLQKGHSDRYQVVFSGHELTLPIVMAVQRQDPMLQQILTKVLLSIHQDELNELERKWLSLTIQTGIKPETVLLWSSLGAGVFVLSLLLFLGWNRTLRRQISQRREAEQRLEEQLAFVQMMLDALPNQVVLTNERHEIAMTNWAYRQLFLQGENLNGSCYLLLQDRLPEAIRARVIEEDTRVWESGEELNGSGEIQLPDGALHQMLYTKRLFVGPDNKRLGILTVLTDVTELKQARSAAQEAETRLTQITDSMPGLVYQYHWIGPGNGRFLYTSQGLKEIVGYDEDPVHSGVVGSTILGLTGPALHDFVATVERHARTMQPLDLEVDIMRHGTPCYLQIRGHFVHQEGLEGVILNGVVQDITSLKRQALELRQARTVAEEAMQARSRFLATMSHELRTPISGMHGMLELLQMSDLDDDQRYMLRNVSTSTNHLLYLVNDILDFSKMEAGQLQLHYQVGRLTTVICDVIRGHATLAHGKGLGVTLAWAAEVPDQASIDAIRVGQVISNLLNNAVKFTESGQIDIRVGYDDHRLVFIVQDSGIGIPLEKQANLFIPFKQVESDITRRFGGTGLGLAICHQLAQKMGGSLTLESQPGVGTRMTFRIPLSECQWDVPPLAGQDWWWFGEDAVLQSVMERLGARLHRLEPAQWQPSLGGRLLAQESHLEQALGGDWLQHLQQSSLKGIVLSSQEALRGRMGSDAWWRLGQSPLYPDLLLETCRQLSGERAAQPVQALGDKLQGRVLVADDHPVNRALLARQLAILGIDAELVDDGEKALRAWQGQGFALLLTDCHMPVMDGYTLTRTLRAAGEEAPIIGVTADASEEASLQMQAAGMNDMLFKPYSLETLRQTLERWLPTASLPSGEPEPLVQARVQEQGLNWLSLFGDEGLARSMAMEYLDSNRQDSEDMMRALARQDAQALVETAHRIKGAARMVGQLALAEEAARLETAARLKQLDRLTELSQTVQALMDSITGEIGLWLDE
ncbi:transporter substrate-binding domain-containing protein [Aeromonas aquatica]|uniref:transporter substrate-binding domain-containing protein n=1 Tax=Aeromonas aquatica TaxID=558964 RepID=UPI00286ED356|nr:transporter substrate-binding domain-containing protein [Aeromonas aquatica]